MDTSYVGSGANDMDFNGMFDQYSHKPSVSVGGSGGIDVSLSVGGSLHSPAPPPHAPSPSPSSHYPPQQHQYARFDSPLNNPSMNPSEGGSVGEGGSPSHPHPHQPQHGMGGHQSAMYPHQGHHGVDLGGNNPHFPPQQMYIPSIAGQVPTTASTSYMTHPGMMSPSNPVYTAPHSVMMGGRGQPPMGGYYHPSMGGVPSSVPGESPASGESPSPGSEDSNDDITRHNKRPSPDGGDVPAGAGAGRGKKPKLSKKNKKKKDPNEPHKPVSAYALFFRDTQANIRGQNPNASFGEVSKIVASLWDSLDADTKNVYKKKTEVAKKEYLKQLAAYRATLVSKGGEGDSKYPGGTQGFAPHYAQAYNGGGGGGSGASGGYPGGLNPQMPPQQSPMGHPSMPPHPSSPHMSPMMEGAMMGSAPPMSQPMPPSGGAMMPQHQHLPPLGGGGMGAPGPSPGYLTQQASPGVGSPASNSTSPAPPHQPPHPLHHAPHSPHLYNQAQHSPPQQQPPPSQSQQQQQYAPQPQYHQQPPPQASPELQQLHQHVPLHHQQQQQPPQHQHQHSSPAMPNTSSNANSPNNNVVNTLAPNNNNNNTSINNHNNNSSSESSSDGGGDNNNKTGGAQHQQEAGGAGGGHCIRSGCHNPAVQSAEWENEYCSDECVVNHCRDVFSTWVAGNQNSSPGYPAPVK